VPSAIIFHFSGSLVFSLTFQVGTPASINASSNRFPASIKTAGSVQSPAGSGFHSVSATRPPEGKRIVTPRCVIVGAHYLTIATIRSPGGGEHLLGPESPQITVDFGLPSPGGLAGFIRLGIEHILTGYDHLLFLFALLVGATSFWRVLGIASMFTLAHSITLSLAVLGLVHMPGNTSTANGRLAGTPPKRSKCYMRRNAKAYAMPWDCRVSGRRRSITSETW
jgi:hypothetical protein